MEYKSLKITGTTTWPGGSMTHSFVASSSIVSETAFHLKTNDLSRIASRIAWLIFIDYGDELTELSNVSYKEI
jgi:hypothetical protein